MTDFYCNDCISDKICDKCKEDLFREPDFELEHEVAELKEKDPTVITFVNGSRLEVSTSDTHVASKSLYLQVPKAYKIDFSKDLSTSDIQLLLMAVISEVTFYDNHKMFKDISHLLKEV